MPPSPPFPPTHSLIRRKSGRPKIDEDAEDLVKDLGLIPVSIVRYVKKESTQTSAEAELFFILSFPIVGICT